MPDNISKSTPSNWHDFPIQRVLQQLESTTSGLTSAAAQTRIEKYGPNRMPEAAKSSALKRFLFQFHNNLIYVLIGCALVTAFLDHWVDTWVIMAVVLTSAIIGFIQEGKAEKAMDAIRHMLAPHANVNQNGERISI